MIDRMAVLSRAHPADSALRYLASFVRGRAEEEPANCWAMIQELYSLDAERADREAKADQTFDRDYHKRAAAGEFDEAREESETIWNDEQLASNSPLLEVKEAHDQGRATVLRCEIVDVLGFSEAEVNSFHGICSEIVERRGGVLLLADDDCLYACFGYPNRLVGHEQQALYAAGDIMAQFPGAVMVGVATKAKLEVNKRVQKHQAAIIDAVIAPYLANEANQPRDIISAFRYTGGLPSQEAGSTMDKEAAQLALAAENGISVAELQEAIDNYKAAKHNVTKREAADHATAELQADENKPDVGLKLSSEQVAAVISDSTLGRLQARYDKLLKIDFPAEGLTDITQARLAAKLSTTFYNLQARRKELGLSSLPKDPKVMEARRLRALFGRRKRNNQPLRGPVRRGRPPEGSTPA